MKTSINPVSRLVLVALMWLAFAPNMVKAQETTNNYNVVSPFHNQLFFNRFMINPTYSLVRENKSYLNVLLRNQYAGYQDNNQNYYLGFSNKLDKNTALGLGMYGQWSGVIQEFGFNANYATGVALGEKSALTFGANIKYMSIGLDKNRTVANENDPLILEATKQNKIAIEPGINLSVGGFDFGLHMIDMVSYNQTSDEIVTNLGLEGMRSTVQYTHKFENNRGIFEDGRVMPLVQVGKTTEGEMTYTGSLLLDLPKFGWLQGTYDKKYGFSSGIGFNLNKKLSLGYVMGKNFSNTGENLGWNHELSLAYSFKDDLRGTGINVNIAESGSSEDARVDEIVRNYEEQLHSLKEQMREEAVLEDTDGLAYENRLVLDQLILRQDSIEKARDRMFEKRFETMVRLIRHEVKQILDRPEPVRKEKKQYYGSRLAENNTKKAIEKTTKKPFKRDYDDSFIRQHKNADNVGVKSGYYVIANVFKNKTYLNNFMSNLKEQGLDAKKFYNKENGLYYVYLADFNSKEDASLAMTSNLDGSYSDDKWVMEVYNNPVATAEVTFTE
ncbi:PorP/SprF family type IX secretion system membrane protein [Croceivirga radicis]|uniref:PorP/SprF family type IX secretion system membrane protein n=1 Tax=Croceivirga radicis TaxID=1929488 RepID=UPI000255B17B|nr:PorP/SprF family type IX secretion system membrane protein [Croceivirga radicis]